MKGKIIELLEESMEEILHDLGVGKCLKQDPKSNIQGKYVIPFLCVSLMFELSCFTNFKNFTKKNYQKSENSSYRLEEDM